MSPPRVATYAPTAAAIAAITSTPAPAPHTAGDRTADLVTALKGGLGGGVLAGGIAAAVTAPVADSGGAATVEPDGITTVAASGFTFKIPEAAATCRELVSRRSRLRSAPRSAAV